jgi:hypothetical protein
MEALLRSMNLTLNYMFVDILITQPSLGDYSLVVLLERQLPFQHPKSHTSQ